MYQRFRSYCWCHEYAELLTTILKIETLNFVERLVNAVANPGIPVEWGPYRFEDQFSPKIPKM